MMMTVCRHEVCAAARRQERRGDPGVLYGGVGAVREGACVGGVRGPWLTGTDDAEPLPDGAHSDTERGV